MKNNRQRLVKVVYFDEEAALNYLNIFNHGKKEKTKELSTTGKALAEAGLEAKASLFPFLKAKAKASASAEAAKLVKNKITNTVLSDFLDNDKLDSSFVRFDDYGLKVYPGSLTSVKTVSPIIKALKGELSIDAVNSLSIEVSKMGDMFSNLKGYSEFLAFSKDREYVFRFNDTAFKNNYRVLDMTGMSVVYYGVEVGRLSSLSELEFSAITKSMAENNQDIRDKIDQVADSSTGTPSQTLEEVEQIKVFDIVLAGIFINE